MVVLCFCEARDIRLPMRQQWQEILTQFPNEHVVVTNPSTIPDHPTELESGEVVDHDPVLDHLLDRCNLSQFDHYAVKYTGDLGQAIGERGMIRVIEHD